MQRSAEIGAHLIHSAQPTILTGLPPVEATVKQAKQNSTYKMDQTILTNPTETELVTAVHENLYSLFRSMQILPGSEVAESVKIGYHHAFHTNPMFKGAWRTRLPAEEVEATIDETLAWFNKRKAPSFYWWTDPQTQRYNPKRAG